MWFTGGAGMATHERGPTPVWSRVHVGPVQSCYWAARWRCSSASASPRAFSASASFFATSRCASALSCWARPSRVRLVVAGDRADGLLDLALHVLDDTLDAFGGPALLVSHVLPFACRYCLSAVLLRLPASEIGKRYVGHAPAGRRMIESAVAKAGVWDQGCRRTWRHRLNRQSRGTDSSSLR